MLTKTRVICNCWGDHCLAGLCTRPHDRFGKNRRQRNRRSFLPFVNLVSVKKGDYGSVRAVPLVRAPVNKALGILRLCGQWGKDGWKTEIYNLSFRCPYYLHNLSNKSWVQKYNSGSKELRTHTRCFAKELFAACVTFTLQTSAFIIKKRFSMLTYCLYKLRSSSI